MEKGNRVRVYRIILVLIFLFAFALSVFLLVDYSQKQDWYSVLGVVATIMSVALSLFSIDYTCRTNEKTSELLDTIRNQNKKLVDKINTSQVCNNFGDNNLEYIRGSGIERNRKK